MGTLASFSCDHGYSISGSSRTTCQNTGHWDHPPATCNRSMKKTYQCHYSFTFFSFLFLSCISVFCSLSHFVANIFEFTKNIHFLVVTCPALSLTNGGVSYDVSPVNGRYPTGATSSFSCGYGYCLSGSRTRTCLISGIWDKKEQIPICNLSNKIFLNFLCTQMQDELVLIYIKGIQQLASQESCWQEFYQIGKIKYLCVVSLKNSPMKHDIH